jgi:hypothetical protein
MTQTHITRRLGVAEIKALPGEPLYSEVVRHFSERTGHAVEEVEQQVIECLRYLYLVSAHPAQLSGLFLPVEQSIDEIWHYLILQTREYRVLCEERLPGGFFIEHRSVSYNEYGQAPSRETLIEQSLRWLPLYREAFGAFSETASRHWTMVRFLREEMGLPLSAIAAMDTKADA